MILLAADIGGTHSRLALAREAGDQPHILRQRDYPSTHYDDLLPILQDFLRDQPRPAVAVLAVAGPIEYRDEGQRVALTNLPWTLHSQQLQKHSGITRVCLINDFEAVGHGIDALPTDALETLQQGQPRARGLRALIGAGTGLGQSLMYWCDGGYQVHATEGGHADFAPADDTQCALWQDLRRQQARVSWEHLVSGPGLVRIYRFLARTHPGAPVLDDPAAITAQADAPGPARQAVELFVDLYGAQAGNLALSSHPEGGLFIAGGIAPKLLRGALGQRFVQSFTAKNPMQALLRNIPITLVREQTTGLLGALRVAARIAKEQKRTPP